MKNPLQYLKALMSVFALTGGGGRRYGGSSYSDKGNPIYIPRKGKFKGWMRQKRERSKR